MASLPSICSQPLVAKLRLKNDKVLSCRGPGMGSVLFLGLCLSCHSPRASLLLGPRHDRALQPLDPVASLACGLSRHCPLPDRDRLVSGGLCTTLHCRALDLESRLVGLRLRSATCSSVSEQGISPLFTP